jgi:hypothetical protein
MKVCFRERRQLPLTTQTGRSVSCLFASNVGNRDLVEPNARAFDTRKPPLRPALVTLRLIPMSPLAQWTLYGFVACWAIGMGAWFHGTFFFMRWWLARARGREAPLGLLRKVIPGLTVFLFAIALGFLFGWIGQSWGGGWS